MLTVLEALTKSTEYLEKKGIESPRANAEIMLAHILNCKRLQLYLSFDKPLKKDEQKTYREFLHRRANREPVQYITQNVEFYGINFEINNSVFIPRQEIEILVETVLKNIDNVNQIEILDIGTGSANISISLAKNLSNSKITAIDTSNSALDLAQRNSNNNSVDEQIIFSNYDILNSENNFSKQFDIIVSNPPYISKEDFNKLEPELNKFEPSIALTDFSDGFNFYHIICQKSKDLLKNNGKLFLELGLGQFDKVKDIMEENKFENINFVNDYQNIKRVIWGNLL